VPSPLPAWAREWVRTATRAGEYLCHNGLRTRDIYGLSDSHSVFELSSFVVHVPTELNPALHQTVSATQLLFRLGSSEMPAGEQIISLPVSVSDAVGVDDDSHEA
jgi:hypothetical protein